MNCKPGDLAVIVRDKDFPQNVGAFVEVLRAMNSNDIRNFPECGPCEWVVKPLTPIWGFDSDDDSSAVRDTNETTGDDFSLRPIRDSDGEDEMLRIAGKPQEVNA